MQNCTGSTIQGRTPALPDRHLSQVDEFLRRATARTGLSPVRVVTAGRIRPTAAPRTLHNLRPVAGDPLTALATAVGVLSEAVS